MEGQARGTIKLTWTDYAFAAVIALLVLGYFGAENVLQEIEVVVVACFVTLLYIAFLLRLGRQPPGGEP